MCEHHLQNDGSVVRGPFNRGMSFAPNKRKSGGNAACFNTNNHEFSSINFNFFRTLQIEEDRSDKSSIFLSLLFKSGKKDFYVLVNWILFSTGFWPPTQQSDDRKLVSDDWEVGRRWGVVASRHRCQLGDKVRALFKEIRKKFKNL